MDAEAGSPTHDDAEAQLGAPVIADPGGEGWPTPPKVSDVELALYGELAPIVRLAGQARNAARDAYGLACKVLNEGELSTGISEKVAKAAVQRAWDSFTQAEDMLLETANDAVDPRVKQKNGDVR